MGRLRELVSAAWLVVESAVSWVVGWAENWAALSAVDLAVS